MGALDEMLVPTCLDSGEPLKRQRRSVRRAMSRRDGLRRIRCALGRHNPPHDKWFMDWGAVMIGGVCTACGDTTVREVTWIGNAWDFFGAGKLVKGIGGDTAYVDHPKLVEAVDAHLQYLRS